jgi:hypothetical protein
MKFKGVDVAIIHALEREYCKSFKVRSFEEMEENPEMESDPQSVAKNHYHMAKLIWTMQAPGYNDKAIAEIRKAMKLDKSGDFQLFAAFRIFMLKKTRNVSIFLSLFKYKFIN